MPQTYDAIDAHFTEEGDYLIDGFGDWKTTEDDVLRPAVQDIQALLQYPAGSWEVYPSLGISRRFHGLQNTPETARVWEDAIYTAVTQSDLVDSKDLDLETFPIFWDAMLTILTLSVEPTPENGFKEAVQVPTLVDLTQGRSVYY